MGHSASILSLLTMRSPERPKKKAGSAYNQRRLRPDEEQLWQELSKSIKPLSLSDGNKKIAALVTPSLSKKKPQHQSIAPDDGRLFSSPSIKQVFLHGKAPGLDRKTQVRMRRGQVRLEGRLDLHGMIQTEAYRALLNFIEAAYYDGRRSVLVITGKGLTRDGEVGVLRQAVPRWLNEQPLNALIKGFGYAARQHGGEGALYVLIRKKK